MKDASLSNCEKGYVVKCLQNNTRVDGRAFNEFRKLDISFGRDWGSCFVTLGETRVLAQVSCEIQCPKASRPQEGLLNINVELSPMGAANFEPGKQSELSVHLNRMLEKCVKDSRAVDLESLCIKQNEKVWALRVDVNVMNHEGNILDCASIATMAALAHFKRPDVTSDGENIVIHSLEQRDPISTNIHHYPICISYAFFREDALNKKLIADPNLLEEGVAEAHLVYSMNAFKEICSLHLGGSALVDATMIIECASNASKRAFSVVQEIKKTLEGDAEIRKENNFKLFDEFGFPPKRDDCEIELVDELKKYVNKWNMKEKSKKKKKQRNTNEVDEQMEIKSTEKVESVEEDATAILQDTLLEDKGEISDDSDIEIVPTKAKNLEVIDLSDEEEDAKVLVLNPEGRLS